MYIYLFIIFFFFFLRNNRDIFVKFFLQNCSLYMFAINKKKKIENLIGIRNINSRINLWIDYTILSTYERGCLNFILVPENAKRSFLVKILPKLVCVTEIICD